jgi:hypothetical protein
MKSTNGIRILLTLALVALFTGGAFAQTSTTTVDPRTPGYVADAADAAKIAAQQIPPTAAAQLPRNAVAYLGTSYNPAGSPKSVLNLGGFYPVLPDDRLYVGAALDIAFKRNSQPKIVIRPEALPRLYTLEVNNFSLPIYGIVGLGAQIEPTDPVATLNNLKAAVSNVGTEYGINAAIGVTTSVPLSRSLYVSPSFRWVGGDGKPAKIVGVGITWKLAVKARN